MHLDISGFGLPPSSGVAWQSLMKQLRYLLSRRGVHVAQPVCIYENESTGMLAARAFWFLKYLGHPQTHILDGGFQAWQEDGLPIALGTTMPQPAIFESKIQAEVLINTSQLAKLMQQPSTTILDVRASEELTKDNHYQNPRNGMIPNSCHLEWNSLLSPSGSLLPIPQIKAILQDKDIQNNGETVIYCQAGYRSSHTFFVLSLLGWNSIRNYSDSWYDWSRKTALPISEQ